MSHEPLGLLYRLPRTEFSVQETRRQVVRTKPGSLPNQPPTVDLHPTLDLTVEPHTEADPASPQHLVLDIGWLEKLDLSLTLDDRGFITAINAEGGRDISPVITLLSKALPLATKVAAGAISMMSLQQTAVFPSTSDKTVRASKTTLDERWNEQHPQLATLSSALNERIDGLLNQLVDPGSDPESILHTSRALEVLQQQLATIVQARLRWFAEQETVETTYARLTPADLYRVTDSQGILPAELTAAKPQAQHDLHALIAIIDDHRPAQETFPGIEPATDRIRIRRCRPVTIGVYLPKDTIPGTWQLEPSSVRVMDVVDEFSPIDELSLDGGWLHKRKASLAFHNDMSLSTFGFSTTPTMSTAVSSGGDLLNALSTAGQYWANRPTDQERQLERMTTQLNLMQTATDYEILAATSARSAELAVLEQQNRRRDAIGG